MKGYSRTDLNYYEDLCTLTSNLLSKSSSQQRHSKFVLGQFSKGDGVLSALVHLEEEEEDRRMETPLECVGRAV